MNICNVAHVTAALENNKTQMSRKHVLLAREKKSLITWLPDSAWHLRNM